MTFDEANRALVKNLVDSARDSLDTAERERMLNPAAAINRSYYAAFYAASAVLLAEGHHFVKHAGVRSALHQQLVHKNRLPVAIGKAYDTLMETRHMADYHADIRQTTEVADTMLAFARQAVDALIALLPPSSLRP